MYNTVTSGAQSQHDLWEQFLHRMVFHSNYRRLFLLKSHPLLNNLPWSWICLIQLLPILHIHFFIPLHIFDYTHSMYWLFYPRLNHTLMLVLCAVNWEAVHFLEWHWIVFLAMFRSGCSVHNGTGSWFLLFLGQGVVYKLERSCTRLLLKGFC